MRLKRLVIAVGATLLVGGAATSAFAASTINPNTANADAASSNITVTSTGLSTALGNTVFYQQCWRSDAAIPGLPAFDPTQDCSNFNQLSGSISVSGAAGPKVFTVFNGDEPNFAQWACGPGVPTPSSAPTIVQTCYIRVVPNNTADVNNDEFYAYSYVPGAQVPEVPMNVLLPASAALILGAGFLVARKRHSHIPA